VGVPRGEHTDEYRALVAERDRLLASDLVLRAQVQAQGERIAELTAERDSSPRLDRLEGESRMTRIILWVYLGGSAALHLIAWMT